MKGTHRFAALIVAGLLAAGTPAPAGADDPQAARTDRNHELFLGYRAVSTDDEPARAAEYRLLDSGPVLRLRAKSNAGGNHHVLVDANIQDEREHRLEFDWNYKSLLRLGVRTESFVHNLDHLPYEPGAPGARPPAFFFPDAAPPVPRVDYDDKDPGRRYDLDLDIHEVRMRAKLPNYPAHVNLSYWRFEKQGKQQLRFADENCASACHLQSRTRKIDRVTEEVKGGMDAHLGWIDLSFEQLYREFRDKEAIPRDSFDLHVLRPAGVYEHDETPDSTLTESTVRASTSLDGGLVAAASFTIGERENRSDLVEVAPVKADTDFYKAAGDVTYTPGEHWTVNFRYRLLDLDAGNSDQLTSTAIGPAFQPVEVRDAIDVRRAFYAASASYRPVRPLTLRADFSREEIHRGNTGGPDEHHSTFFSPPDIDPVWELPEDEVIDRFRLGARARLLPKSALKVNAWAEYRISDDPAYGTSFEKGKEAFLGGTFTPDPAWGMSANARILDESNDAYRRTQFSAGAPITFDLDRDREQQSLTAGFWVHPAESVTADLHYGYLRTRIVQDLLFGAEPGTGHTIEAEDTEYRQRVQTVAAALSWQVLPRLGARLEGHHIRSKADYSPDFAARSGLQFLVNNVAVTGDADAGDLRDISRIEIRQNGVKTRFDWQVDDSWSTHFEYTWDDYDDRTGDVFDGTVQTYLAGVSRTW